ncbi:hypothetical protein POM88_020609 [Heracleum sosnowskyi]|uniref:Uncharacterized protein n=1 Tax=Heracleum sosnowskyi TaxID=360622 RepID=A0AAD8ID66_9APIA|nr:hypothetical protein POM88_020609 [Heracleum sosnowskyi]
MNTDDDGSKAWHLFDSEEMIHGYKREKHPRKRQMIRNQGRSLNNSPTSCSVEGPLPTSNATSNDELSSSSHRGLKKKKENSSSVIGLPACVGRTPLGDITNKKVRRGLRCKMKLKSLPEEELKSFSRNLFEENFQRDADHDDHDDEIEESLIDGAVVSDDGLFDSDDSYEEYCSTQSFGAHNHSESDSDIEDDMKFAGHRFIPLRREQVIPEEYASLGSPSVQCKYCGARMWKEERIRENEAMTPRLGGRLFQQYMLTNDIKKKSYFGVCIGVMYVVEFQKRGLPHDPVGYAAVKAFMIHGPCGLQNPKSPCMKDFKCIRHFPKKYCARTIFDESGFPLYKRRRTGISVNEVTIDDKQLQFYALAEIDDLLRSIGKSLKNFKQLPQPPNSYLHHGNSPSEINQLNAFAQWVLDIGNGKVLPPEDDGYKYVEDDIVIPAEFCDISNVNSVDNMINSTFPDFLENCQNPKL